MSSGKRKKISCPILKNVNGEMYSNIYLNKDKFSIGRALGNSKVIIELSISRHHCTLMKNSSGNWFLYDHGSCYGTTINRTRIDKLSNVQLKNGDVIQFGLDKSYTYCFKLTNRSTDSEGSDTEIETTEESQLNESQREIECDAEKMIKRTNKRHNTMVQKKECLENEYSQMIDNLDKSCAVETKKIEIKKDEDWELKKCAIETAFTEEKQKLKEKFTKELNFLQEKIDEMTASEQVLATENKKLMQRLEAEREEFNKRLKYERLDFNKRLEYEKVTSGSEQAKTLKLFEEKDKVEKELKKKLKDAQEKNKTLAAKQDLPSTSSNRILRSNFSQDPNSENKQHDMEMRIKKLQELLVEKDAMIKKALEDKEEEKNRELEEMKLLQDAENTAIQLRLEAQANDKERAVRDQLEAEIVVLKDEKAKLEENISSGQSTGNLKHLQDELYSVMQNLVQTEGKKSLVELEMSQNISDINTSINIMEGKESVLKMCEIELQCSICNELFMVATTLNCAHTFCKSCIDQWKRQKKQCPICRNPIKSENRSLALDNFIEKIISNSADDVKNKRKELMDMRSGHRLVNEPSTSRGRARPSPQVRRGRGGRNAPRNSRQNIIPQNAPRNVPQNAPRNVPQNAPRNVPQNAPSNVPQNAPRNLPQNAPQTVTGISPNFIDVEQYAIQRLENMRNAGPIVVSDSDSETDFHLADDGTSDLANNILAYAYFMFDL